MIITHHNVEVKRCLAPFDTIAIVENNMHKEKEKREKHKSGRTKKKTDGLHRGSGVWGRDECM